MSAEFADLAELSAERQDRIVCAANRFLDIIVCSPRHHDATMNHQIRCLRRIEPKPNWEQGFVNQRGEFLTREEAYFVALNAGQIIYRCDGDDGCLYTENLY